MKASDLKPCPFDGHQPTRILFDDEDGDGVEFETRHYVECP